MSKQTGFSFASSKKSLIETIDEIKKSKMPRNEKIVALKACGLREKEISDMLKVYVPSGSTSTRFVYTFGVEIEWQYKWYGNFEEGYQVFGCCRCKS